MVKCYNLVNGRRHFLGIYEDIIAAKSRNRGRVDLAIPLKGIDDNTQIRLGAKKKG